MWADGSSGGHVANKADRLSRMWDVLDSRHVWNVELRGWAQKSEPVWGGEQPRPGPLVGIMDTVISEGAGRRNVKQHVEATQLLQ